MAVAGEVYIEFRLALTIIMSDYLRHDHYTALYIIYGALTLNCLNIIAHGEEAICWASRELIWRVHFTPEMDFPLG